MGDKFGPRWNTFRTEYGDREHRKLDSRLEDGKPSPVHALTSPYRRRFDATLSVHDADRKESVRAAYAVCENPRCLSLKESHHELREWRQSDGGRDW